MTKSNMTFFDHAVSPSQMRTPGRTPVSSRSNADGSSHASSSRNSASTSISVIIGKTFEAATLPDGSQQIIEATKYKRLSDGYVYTESKMRSLDDDRSERSDGRSNHAMGGIREDVGGDDMMRYAAAAGGMRSPDKLYPDGSFLSTFSSSGSFSPANESNHVSVVTEDHGFIMNNHDQQRQHAGDPGMPRGATESFVEEYLYDNDPVGLQQWNENQPLSPSGDGQGHQQQGGGATNGGENTGWCTAYYSDGDDDNSLQLMQQKRTLWDSPVTKRAAETIRNFFPSTPKATPKNGEEVTNGTLDVNYDNRSGGGGEEEDNEEDEMERGVGVRKSNLPCNERMRTRRCRVLVFAIVVVVMGTIATAIAVAVSSSRQVTDSPIEYAEDTKQEEAKDKSPVLNDPPGTEGTQSGTAEEDVATGTDKSPPALSEPSTKPEDATTNITLDIPEAETSTEVAEESATASPPSSDVTTTTNVVTATVSAIEPPSCIHLEIVMSTTPNANRDDDNKWSLSRIGGEGSEDEVTIDSGDAFPELDGDSRSTFKHCVKPGVYTFSITDSGGDGLGANGKGGYYITADGVTLGISSFFFHEERMTFALPFDAGGGRPDSKATACTDAFYLAIKTDGRPEQTEWNVVDNDSGGVVLHGGPYSLPWAVHTRRACLPDGNYTFNMLDEGGDGICCDNGKGFVFLSKDGETIVNSNGEFGKEQSTVFVLGDGK